MHFQSVALLFALPAALITAAPVLSADAIRDCIDAGLAFITGQPILTGGAGSFQCDRCIVKSVKNDILRQGREGILPAADLVKFTQAMTGCLQAVVK